MTAKDLSEMDIAFIKALADGKAQKEIARDLFMSIGTVEAKSASLRKRFNCKNSTQLVAIALPLIKGKIISHGSSKQKQ
jgi:DNA-binding NarL/FixJ family response regulator